MDVSRDQSLCLKKKSFDAISYDMVFQLFIIYISLMRCTNKLIRSGKLLMLQIVADWNVAQAYIESNPIEVTTQEASTKVTNAHLTFLATFIQKKSHDERDQPPPTARTQTHTHTERPKHRSTMDGCMQANMRGLTSSRRGDRGTFARDLDASS